MKPHQCGNSARNLTPGDRGEIEAFGRWLDTGAATHLLAVRRILKGDGPRQLVPGLPFHVDEFVKVTAGGFNGRWGLVTEVIDYRHLHRVGADNTARLSFLVMVDLLTTRPGVGIQSYPPAPQPFEPHELTSLFDGYQRAGDYVRSGRVVSKHNWPTPRTGTSEAS